MQTPRPYPQSQILVAVSSAWPLFGHQKQHWSQGHWALLLCHTHTYIRANQSLRSPNILPALYICTHARCTALPLPGSHRSLTPGPLSLCSGIRGLWTTLVPQNPLEPLGPVGRKPAEPAYPVAHSFQGKPKQRPQLTSPFTPTCHPINSGASQVAPCSLPFETICLFSDSSADLWSLPCLKNNTTYISNS